MSTIEVPTKCRTIAYVSSETNAATLTISSGRLGASRSARTGAASAAASRADGVPPDGDAGSGPGAACAALRSSCTAVTVSSVRCSTN